MSDQKKIELTLEKKDEIVKERFTAFVQSLAHEIGESPVGAIATICWQEEDRVSVAITLGKSPAILQMKIIDLMGRKFAQAINYIKVQVNTRRESPSD